MNSRIKEPPTDFVYQNRTGIIKGACIIPFAIEGIRFLGALIFRREEVKKNFDSGLQSLKITYQPQMGESRQDAKKRIAINIAITFIFAAAIGTTFVILPYLYAIPVALSILASGGKVLCNLEELKSKTKNFFLENFTKKEDESLKYALFRIGRNIVITSLFCAILSLSYSYYLLPLFLIIASSMVSGSMLLKKGINNQSELLKAFKKKESETSKEATLRITKNVALAIFAISAIVFLAILTPTINSQLATLFSGDKWPHLMGSVGMILIEYFTIGLIHFVQAIRTFSSGNKEQAAFHVIMGLSAFILPLIRTFLGCEETNRIHHDFLGLMISLIPSNSIKLFGAAYVIDSALLQVKPNSYGFDNIVVDHFFSHFLPILLLATVLQKINDELVRQPSDKKNKTTKDDLSTPLLENSSEQIA